MAHHVIFYQLLYIVQNNNTPLKCNLYPYVRIIGFRHEVVVIINRVMYLLIATIIFCSVKTSK